ncbi:MAG: amidohydrolase [Chitinophagales bacterium]
MSIKQHSDIILHHSKVYTVNEKFEIAEAIAVKNGKIQAVGTNEHILSHFQAKNSINVQGKTIFPGFYDAHCHFLRYAAMLNEVLLFDCKSIEEVIANLKQFRKQNPKTTHLVGRGWNEDKWPSKKMPTKQLLDKHFPDLPVLLIRIDLHAAVANTKALEVAKIDENTTIEGGIIEQKNNELTGLLIDKALYRAAESLPQLSRLQLADLLLEAQKHCHAVGLTTLNEALIDVAEINLIVELQQKGLLKMRFYMMVNSTEANKKYFFENGIYKDDFLNIRTFKYFADGALGSRGAWLLKDYSDAKNHKGLALLDAENFEKDCKEYAEKGFQVATHAIGDAANRFVLETYGKALQPNNDKRWRLEHAQIVDKNDMYLFEKYRITPSIQATHATSDMYWVEKRLGKKRLQDAYCFQDLWQKNGFVAAGSDFPVEKINPLLGFYAAVARQDVVGFPEKGFQIENALSRKQALQAMTIHAAYSNFEEQERGSIEVGKMADLVVLENDIMEVEMNKVPQTKVLMTFLGGEKVF